MSREGFSVFGNSATTHSALAISYPSLAPLVPGLSAAQDPTVEVTLSLERNAAPDEAGSARPIYAVSRKGKKEHTPPRASAGWTAQGWHRLPYSVWRAKRGVGRGRRRMWRQSRSNGRPESKWQEPRWAKTGRRPLLRDPPQTIFRDAFPSKDT